MYNFIYFSKEIDFTYLAYRTRGLLAKRNQDVSDSIVTVAPALSTIHTSSCSTHIGVHPASNLVSVFLNKISPDKHDGEPLYFRGYSENDFRIKYCHLGR